jgi:hypothetical protein
MYKGYAQNGKPNGRGYLIDETGTKFGEFKDGVLLKELVEPGE